MKADYVNHGHQSIEFITKTLIIIEDGTKIVILIQINVFSVVFVVIFFLFRFFLLFFVICLWHCFFSFCFLGWVVCVC